MNLKTERGAPQEYVDLDTGRRFFSVTQVRQVIFNNTAMIPPDVLEVARHRGTLLHQRFWRLLASRVKLVDPPAIIPGLEGYCSGMDGWAEQHKVEPIEVEAKVIHHKLGYAGTLDAGIYYGVKSWKVLMDLKTGQRNCTDPMQLLAYREANERQYSRMLDLYLFANGSIHEQWVTIEDKLTHWPGFLNGLSVLQWRLAYGR